MADVPQTADSGPIPEAAITPATGASGPGADLLRTPSPLQSADIDQLLQQAQDAIADVDRPVAPPSRGAVTENAIRFQMAELASAPPNEDEATLELIRDVELDLRIELGRTHLPIEDVLRLKRGSVVTLEKLAGDPVDVFVNGRLVARGEILVLNDNFCVRVVELVAGDLA